MSTTTLLSPDVESPFEKELKDQLAKKIEELAPAAHEHARLMAMLNSINRNGDVPAPAPAPPAPARAASPAPAPSAKPRTTPAKRGGKRGARGQRQEQFLTIVKENPGITVSEVAKRLGIEPNYVYRLRNQASGKGEISVQGSNLFAVEVSDERAAAIARSGSK